MANMYSTNDIRNNLTAIQIASDAALHIPPDCKDTEAYRRGFSAALLAVAASFGFYPSASLPVAVQLDHKYAISVQEWSQEDS